MIETIDQLLAGGMPYKLRHASLNPDHQHNSIEDNFVEGQDEQVFAVQCYHYSEKSDNCIIDWTEAYQKEDTTTQALASIVTLHKPHKIPSSVIATAPSEYKSMTAKGLIAIVSDKLVYFKPILMNMKYVNLMIVPESLR